MPDSRSPSPRRVDLPLLVLLVVVAAALLTEVALVMAAAHGAFVYSLDDPYIHLALARNIAEGHYGLNPGENSSPASSPLWPLLLAPWPSDWAPLVLAGAAVLATAAVLHRSFATVCRPWAAAALALGTIVFVNGIGIAFTGMEHSLQVLLAAGVGAGVLACVRGGAPSRWFVAALAIGPLVRYESAALSVAAAVVLVALGHRRTAAVATAAWVGALAAFSVFLVSLGLDPLPSSILAKSGFEEGFAAWLGARLEMSFSRTTFLLPLGLVVLDLALRRRWTLLHTFWALALGAHCVAGSYGWWGRYEAYLLFALAPIAVQWASQWSAALAARPVLAGATRPLVALVAVVCLIPMWAATLLTPPASRDIASQQAQTAAFVRDVWRQPIAVNDLGLVALRGEAYVLDLWGLASQEARTARLSGDDPAWMASLLAEKGVTVAALYPGWFEDDLPEEWIEVGTLRGAPVQMSWDREVTFFAVDDASARELCAALEEFAPQAGPDTTVTCTLG